MAVLFLIATAALFDRIMVSRRHPNVEPPASGAHKQSLETWLSQEYVNLTNGVDIASLVAVIPLTAKTELSADQEKALRQEVVDVINACRTGTFEDYARFRLPVNKAVFSPALSNLMRTELLVPENIIRDNPIEAYRPYFERFTSNHFSVVSSGTTSTYSSIQRFTGTHFSTVSADKTYVYSNNYTNHWIGLSVSNCNIDVTRSTSSSNDLRISLTHSSPQFSSDSIANVKLLGTTIRHPTNELTIYIRDHLSQNTSNLLFKFDKPPPYSDQEFWGSLQRGFLDDLNSLIQSGPIYTEERFRNVRLSAVTSNLMVQVPKGDNLVNLNRLLLVDAYPGVLLEVTPVANAGFSGVIPNTHLLPTRAQVVKQYGFVDVATIAILPKPRDNFAPSKVYIRSYWSPEDKKWLPQQMIMADARGDRGPMLHF